MKKENNLKFKHDKESIHEAICISKEEYFEIQTDIMLFEKIFCPRISQMFEYIIKKYNDDPKKMVLAAFFYGQFRGREEVINEVMPIISFIKKTNDEIIEKILKENSKEFHEMSSEVTKYIH